MFFSLRELLRWLGITVFEIWTALVCFTIFTVLLTLKVDTDFGDKSLTWWIVFSPLFVCDALNAYFCVIVFIRMYLDNAYKLALVRAIWSQFMISLLFVFKYLLCQKLTGSESKLEYSEVMGPVFMIMIMIMIRACQLH